MIRESAVEKYLVQRVKALGGRYYKFKSGGGVPDRIVVTPSWGADSWGVPHPPETFWVELKRPTSKLRPLQKHVHDDMMSFGLNVFTLYSKSDVDAAFPKP